MLTTRFSRGDSRATVMMVLEMPLRRTFAEISRTFSLASKVRGEKETRAGSKKPERRKFINCDSDFMHDGAPRF